MIEYDKDGDGIAHIIWNNPHSSVNVKSEAAIAAFAEAVEKAVTDETVRGVLIRSAKRDFVAGGDLMELYAVKTPQEALSKVSLIGNVLRRMERGGKPFVAVLNGSALGGGLEIALACHRRIAVDDSRLKLGCPEVTLGLIPGAGGTQRLPRLVGIAAGSKMLMSGKSIGVNEALKIGLIDEVVSVDQLLEAGRNWILSQPDAVQPWDKKGFVYPDFEPQSLKGRMFFFNEWPQLRRKSSPEDFASGALLHVLGQGLEREIDAGLVIEQRYFAKAVVSSSAKNRIRNQFIAPNAIRKQAEQGKDNSKVLLQYVGVVGAGTMGSGIALVCARAGLQTVLLDRDDETARRGLERIAKTLEGSVQRKLMSSNERDETLSRIQTGSDFGLLKKCEIVVEAVIEVVEAKVDVFKRVVAAAGPQVLLASNTSTLSITKLAEHLEHAENFIGLHFFAPVDRMKLVEVIRGNGTSEATLNRSLDFLKRLRKTPVVVNDGPGFYTSRVVAAYTREALHMLNEGVSPTLIDNSAVIAGFPIGPLTMADLTSYDLLSDILNSLASDGRGTAAYSEGALEAANKLVAAGRLGRKNEAGVYDYTPEGKTAWEGLSGIFPLAVKQPDAEEVIRRLLHIQSLETIHAMDEGVADDPLALDSAAVLGWSYPAWRGGVLAHVDDIGVEAFIEECAVLVQQYGKRFEAPMSLQYRASKGVKFHMLSGGSRE